MKSQNIIRRTWLSIPKSYRTEIISAWHTFVPAFIGSVIISFQVTGSTEITTDIALSVVLAATRAGFKAVSVWFFSRYGKSSV